MEKIYPMFKEDGRDQHPRGYSIPKSKFADCISSIQISKDADPDIIQALIYGIGHGETVVSAV